MTIRVDGFASNQPCGHGDKEKRERLQRLPTGLYFNKRFCETSLETKRDKKGTP